MKSIILIDKNEVMRMILNRMLADSPLCTVIGESAGVKEAIALCESDSPDIILLSQNIADMHIIDAIMEFKISAPDAKIIVCMNPGQQELIMAASTIGAAAFITKPVKKALLLRAVKDAFLEKAE